MKIPGFWKLPDIAPMKIPLPIGKLYYMDYHYETLGEQRRNKIEKIKDKLAK